MSYVRQRRPALFGQPPRPYDASSVTSEELAGVPAVDVAEAQRWMASGAPLVVDLRGPFAWAAAHIEGSINIVDELFDELLRGGSPFPKSRPVLLACPVGEKSARYAALLGRMGHPHAQSLAGGVVAWRDAGAPLVAA